MVAHLNYTDTDELTADEFTDTHVIHNAISDCQNSC